MTTDASDPLYHDPDLAALYDLDNSWGDDLEYCLKLGREAKAVLDFGCGTGRLIAAIASYHFRFAVGVDPAGAMLEIARRRPGGEHAHWIVGDARNLRLIWKFDLIVMTGHAFQTLLTPEDQLAALQTIAAHLTPWGHFIFDTRNPLVEEWREWTPELSQRTIAHPTLGSIEAWNDVRMGDDTGIVTYETNYRVAATGSLLSSTASELRFSSKQDLETLIAQAGLAVDTWLGDWTGGPLTDRSTEIIPYGRKAP